MAFISYQIGFSQLINYSGIVVRENILIWWEVGLNMEYVQAGSILPLIVIVISLYYFYYKYCKCATGHKSQYPNIAIDECRARALISWGSVHSRQNNCSYVSAHYHFISIISYQLRSYN